MSDSKFDPRPEVLAGRFVRVEPLAEGHAEDLLAAGSDPSIWRYLPRPPFESLEDVRDWIGEAVAATREGSQIAYAILSLPEEKAVGSTRLLDIRRPDRGMEIGWTWLGTQAQRSAVNTETKLLLLGYCFESQGAIRVQLKTDGRNTVSQRAIERLGAAREGVLRRNTRLWDGFVRDSVYYSILEDEWPGVRSSLEEKLQRSTS